ncbi:MAG: LysM peptidoglycan-binding domain-containing protein [Lachnospiraceae bacterium]|nr:LysM peptidoglycan-binding domain-containing protein [Lachnospiraceae bacterium]
MIEIVNEPRPAEEMETREPRNIRQIGNVSGKHMVYMEDYVYRFLHRKDRKVGRAAFVFLGDMKNTAGRNTVYIKGALELSDISFGGGLPVFSEDMWDEIYRQTRQYFPQWSIVGWAMQAIGLLQESEKDIRKICNRHFPANHGNVYLYDAYGEWEKMYVDVDGKIIPQEGFCIYYEKNTPMGNYLSAYHSKLEQQAAEGDYRNNERFLIHDESRYTDQIRQDAEAMARYRAYMNGRSEKNYRYRIKAAISIAVVMLVLLSGVLLQSFVKLSDMQKAVQTLSNEDAVEKAQEDVIKQTIEKKATELAEADTEGENKQESQQSSEQQTQQQAQPTDATQDQNPYLAQGYYIVEQGDKLTDISKKVYGNEDMVQAICEKNQLPDSNHIEVGDKLLLP